MQRKQQTEPSLDYLLNPPKRLKWKIVAGPPGYELSDIQKYDLIFDKTDLKIRQMDTKENLDKLIEKED